ncbi:stage II sporulation protein P [Anaerobacillus sp. CMMVII]|uniref:stage II sporulation protein P n=1 Tax=Anaerobacillus sp. CMMVII TaxID=2755588 RepID=UPI0021B7E228|nr:stage II sporulation protein P [Anaerobacillus sp. CMMVII]MCT8140251.1 stage II sporulation protein P [Anaerobacillus sp. CMMVII]
MNNEEMIKKLKKTKSLNSPRKEFESELEEMLVEKFSKKSKNKLYLSYFSSVVASLLILLLIVSNQPNLLNNAVYNKDFEPVVFIYHTHNYEAFLGEKADPSMAWDENENITSLGKFLSSELEKRGVSALHDATNYHLELENKGMEYAQSYNLSREIVMEALNTHKSLEMTFDIHRDVQPRSITTTTINGEEVARINIVIGDGHENYLENLEFAKELYYKIENFYPNLARGVIASSHRNYNQDLLNKAFLIEIGGHENTIEEAKRSASYLAEVLADILN